MSYEKQGFTNGQTLTAAHLNHMEDGIAAAMEASDGGQNGDGITAELKTALTNYFTHVMPTFDDTNGMGYVNAILTALGAETRGDSGDSGDDSVKLLYSWDLTKSLVDTVGGVTATLGGGATQDSNGVKLASATDWANFPVTAWAANRVIEVDVASFDRKGTAHARIMTMYNHAARSEDSGLIYRATGYWQVYGQASGWMQNTEYTDPAYISGKTAKAVVNSNYAVSWYIGDAQIAENVDFTTTMTTNNGDASLYIGSKSGSSAYDLVITGVRIYEGV